MGGQGTAKLRSRQRSVWASKDNMFLLAQVALVEIAESAIIRQLAVSGEIGNFVSHEFTV